MRSFWAVRAARKKPRNNAQPSAIARSGCTAARRSAVASAYSILSARLANAALRGNACLAFPAKHPPIARARRIPPATPHFMSASSAPLMRTARMDSAVGTTPAKTSLPVPIPSAVRRAACVIRARTNVRSVWLPVIVTSASRVRTITAPNCAARTKTAPPAVCSATARATPASNASSALIARAPSIAAKIAVSATFARLQKPAAACKEIPSKSVRPGATAGFRCSVSRSTPANSSMARQPVRTGTASPTPPLAAWTVDGSSAAQPTERRARSSVSVKRVKFAPTLPAERTSVPPIRSFAAEAVFSSAQPTARPAAYSPLAARTRTVTTARVPA